MASLVEAQLSAVLRRRLAPAHAALEQASGLPDRIQTRADYIAWLRSYYRLFAMLEPALAAFPDWTLPSLCLSPVRRAPMLRDDLHRLGAFESETIGPAPPLASFGQALGVTYVLEGSALGGQVILASLERRLGPQIEGATRFFAGSGRASMAVWQRFKAGLDQYGATHPDAQEQIVQGAALCFGMFLDAARGVPA